MSDVARSAGLIGGAVGVTLGILLIGAGLIGYDLLGDRTATSGERSIWVEAPVWGELILGGMALAVGLSALRKLR